MIPVSQWPGRIVSRWVAGWIACVWAGGLYAQELRITGWELDTTGRPHITHSADTLSYFVLQRGSALGDLVHPQDVRLGLGPVGVLTDAKPPSGMALYRVRGVPLDAPEDLDRDGLDDVYELRRAPALNPLDDADALADADRDLRSNLAEARAGTDPLVADFFVTTSPRHHETGVSVNRETVFRFTVPLAPGAIVDHRRMWSEAAGRRLLARVELSSDRRTASLFPLEPVPGGTRVRVTLDGAGLSDGMGRPLDLDADGQPGGTSAIEFTTSPVSPVASTAVIGRVFASERMPDPQSPGGFTNRPLGGVTITVDGAEETLRAVTDAEGRFILEPVPAGRFFVHVDGRTVSNPAAGVHWPDLAYYPFVGKAWTAASGSRSNLAGGSGEIFLPLIPAGALTEVNATAETKVRFVPEIIAANPALEGVEITVPPNALFDDQGMRGGRVGLAPVPPDRLPEPLPAGLRFPLVITVQTSGPGNFEPPVPAKFPNLPDPDTGRILPPGARSALWSFDHDTGRWELAGPMRVSDDGKYVVTDPGVGIRQPGWHGCMPGSTGDSDPPGGGGPPKSTPPRPRPPAPPLPPASSPPPPPPQADGDGDDDGNDNNDQGLPDFPELPDIPFVNEPGSWGDVMDVIAGRLPTIGPSIFGDIVDIGDAAVDVADEIGDAMDGTPDYSGGDPDTADIVEDVDKMLDEMASAAADKLPSVPDNASDASNTVKKWWEIWSKLYGNRRQGAHGRMDRSASGDLPQAAVQPLMELQREGADWERLATLQEAFDDFFRTWLGTDRWNALAATGVRIPEVLPLLQAALAAQRGGTEGGMAITAAESALILAAPPARIPASFREEVMARLALTVENYAAGIRFHSQAAPGRTDFADAGQWRDATRRLEAELRIEHDAGFTIPAGRGQSLARRTGPALGRFFGAFLNASRLEPAAENQSYVLLEVFAPGSPAVRYQYLRSDLRGELTGLIVPADAVVIVRWLNPRTLQTATSYFLSGQPGSNVRLPKTVWKNISDARDTDQDGLPDMAERIVGTRPDLADSDGDGVNDGPEVLAGTNPLDGIVLQPGISGSADTPGNAVDVAVETFDLSPFGGASAVTRILVADGKVGGVAVLELLNQQPVLLGRLDTSGDARRVALPSAGGLLAEEIGLAAAADGAGGLVIVDLMDPLNPQLRRQVPLNGTTLCVTIAEGLAYAGTENGSVVTVDLFSGEVLAETDLGFPIHDLRVSRGVLYVAGPRGRKLSLQSLPLLAGGRPGKPGTRVDSDGLNGLRGLRLSVGDDVAYLVHGRGINTFDVTDPLLPRLIVESNSAQFGWKQVAPDGTGLAVACVGANSTDDGPHDVSVYDVSDPARTDRFVTTITTPGLASAVTLHAGRAFVADGTSGLQVIDYSATDRGTTAPEARLVVLPQGPTVSAARMLAAAHVSDDVQVHRVELLVNGEPMGRDESWPFELSFEAPVWSPFNTNLVAQVRVVDGAGNAALSAPITVPLVPDILPPHVISFSPGTERTVAGPDPLITVAFDEAMNPSTLDAATLRLFNAGPDGSLGTPDDVVIPGATVGYLERAHAALLRFPVLPSETYRIVVTGTVLDASGNPLGGSVSSDFRVFEMDLRNGGSFLAEGSFPAKGVSDEYGFMGRAGQELFFNLESPSTLGLEWSVRDESGSELFRDKAIGDRGIVTLPHDGRYRLNVLRLGAIQERYRISVWDVPTAQEFAITVGDTVSDGVPAAGAGRIESPGTLDRYTFTALPGQQVFFDILEGVSAGLAWKLADETDAVVFEGGFIGDAGVVTLKQGGTYVLTVGHPMRDFAGPYSFKMWNVPTAQEFAITVGDTVSDGMPATGAGRIESPGTLDRYTFTALPGQNVFFDLLEGTSAGLAWKLTDETGAVVFDGGFIGDAGVVTLKHGGSYILTLGHPTRDFTGPYSFKVWDVPQPQEFGMVIGDTIEDGVPAPGAGRIESPGSLDRYTFTSLPGQNVFFDLLKGASAGLAWKLMDETGAVVFDGGFIGDVGLVTLKRGGSYILTLGHPTRDFTGPYSFKVWNVPTAQEFAITVGDTVSDGVPAPGAGRIESPGSLDRYTFTALPGQNVFFDLLEGTSASLVWKLADETGAVVFDEVFIGDAGVVTLKHSGSYVLTLGHPTRDFTGTYSFKVSPFP